jgi:hypothetical protein
MKIAWLAALLTLILSNTSFATVPVLCDLAQGEQIELAEQAKATVNAADSYSSRVEGNARPDECSDVRTK